MILLSVYRIGLGKQFLVDRLIIVISRMFQKFDNIPRTIKVLFFGGTFILLETGYIL